MTHPVPVWPLHEMLATHLKADATLAGMLAGNKVYSTLVDREGRHFPYDYLVLGDTNNRARGTFGRGGHRTKQDIQICAADKRRVSLIYGHLYRLLHNVSITLTDHTMVHGTAELILTMPEPDYSGERGLVAYTVHTLVG